MVTEQRLHEMDETTLTRWIVDTTQSAIKHHQSPALNEAITLLNDHGNTIKNSISNLITTTSPGLQQAIKRSKQVEANCIGIIKQNEQRIKNIKQDIESSEVQAISVINTTANKHITQINDTILSADAVLRNIEMSKSIPAEILSTIQTTTSSFKSTMSTAHETFEEDIYELVDEQKQQFRDWIETITNGNNLMEMRNLAAVRSELKSELELLKAERIIYQERRREMDDLRNEILAMRQHTSHHNDISDDAKYDSDDDQPADVHNNNHTAAQTNKEIVINGPQFKTDQKVHYKKGIRNFHGYITDDVHPYLREYKWYYSVYSTNGNTVFDCAESDITPVTTFPPMITSPEARTYHINRARYRPSTSPSTIPRHEIDNYDNCNHEEDQIPFYHRGRQVLAHNEFVYPHGSRPQTVAIDRLLKSGEKWSFDLHRVSDLRTFYDLLQSRLTTYGIYLKPYSDITKQAGIEQITPETCLNYETATTAMSNALFQYFTTYGKTIFSKYTEPLSYISAYRTTSDGFGFLKKIMEKRHPRLKQETTDLTTHKQPIFKDYANIHEFINAYIEWLNDENIRGRGDYTDKEKLDYVIESLDSRFDIAKQKISRIIDDIYIDINNPKPIPPYLQLSQQLGLYIIEKIPEADREDLTNNPPSSHPNINRMSNNRNTKESTPHKDDHKWADNLTWELLPGEICPACGTANHNVYKTGCPILAKYATCQAFMKMTPANKLEPVRKAFDTYQKSRNSVKTERKRSDRRVIKNMQATYNNDELGTLKKIMYTSFITDYPEEAPLTLEQYINEADSEPSTSQFE